MISGEFDPPPCLVPACCLRLDFAPSRFVRARYGRQRRARHSMAASSSTPSFLVEPNSEGGGTEEHGKKRSRVQQSREEGGEASTLKNFSMRVAEKVESKGSTTYTQVADEVRHTTRTHPACGSHSPHDAAIGPLGRLSLTLATPSHVAARRRVRPLPVHGHGAGRDRGAQRATVRCAAGTMRRIGTHAS